MARLRRVADIRTGRKIAALVLKDALEHDIFLAAAMGVGGEGTIRIIADDRRRAGNLVADPVEHAAVNAGRRRCLPVDLVGMQHDALCEIGIQFHNRVTSLWKTTPRTRSPSGWIDKCLIP